MLEADVAELIEVSRKLDQLGNNVDGLDIRTRSVPVLAGTEIHHAFDELGEKIEGAYLRVADRLRSVATEVDRCARDYSVTDTEFAARMNDLDFTSAQD